MHGIKIVSSFAALAAFAEAHQQFVMAAECEDNEEWKASDAQFRCITDEQTCEHRFGTWADGATAEDAGVCTPETNASKHVRVWHC